MNKRAVFAAVVVSAAIVLTGCGGKKEKGVSGGAESGDSSGRVEAMESGANAGDGAKSTETGDGAKFTDSRDGKTYKTVKIGTAVWMAENLNFAAEGSECYENNAGNCEKYGRLYDWATALKACPAGFHLPTNDEWTALVNYAGGEDKAGKKLKSAAGWNENGNGTNDFGFSALPGGYGGPVGNFYGAGDYGYWWSATEDDADGARYRFMYYDNEDVNWGSDNKASLISVRCVAD
jgi:uncharacterized protein (TIGR02145 family)